MNYSVYIFTTVKIRNEIYFVKTLIEKIDNIFDDIDYDEIINSHRIKEYDEIINDKNFMKINEKTKYILKEYQDENLFLLEEPFELFINSLKDYYKLENEVLPFYNIFEEILKNKNKNYSDYINESIEKTLNKINLLLNDFKNVLNKQIKLKKKYDSFNINKNKFNEVFQDYYKTIENTFIEYKEKINKLKLNDLFYNSLKLIIRKFKKEKTNLIKNNFNDYSKKINYDYEFLGYDYNLGEQIKSFLDNEFNEYEFNLNYKYFELYENNANIYIDNIIKKISEQETELKTNLEKKIC